MLNLWLLMSIRCKGHGSCFTNVSRALQNNLVNINNAKIIFMVTIGFGHTYKVSAWNSHKTYDFCKTHNSGKYFEDVPKRQWSKTLVISNPFIDLVIPTTSRFQIQIIMNPFTKNSNIIDLNNCQAKIAWFLGTLEHDWVRHQQAKARSMHTALISHANR